MQRIHRNMDLVEGRIKELPGGTMSIPSFTAPGVRYKVHVEAGYCSCPAAEHGPADYRCKHGILAEAVQNARKLRFGSRIAEERITEMCFDIFARLRQDDTNYIGSYLLALSVTDYRHATKRMEDAAWKQHRRTLLLAEQAEGRAA